MAMPQQHPPCPPRWVRSPAPHLRRRTDPARYIPDPAVPIGIYPYMANDSLHDWLHDRLGGGDALQWRDRLRIARGASRVTTELVGTPGYIPPEYGQAWVATRRGDVYSFGVVLLELLAGRRPLEVLPAQRRHWELVGWVTQMRSLGRHDEVLDHRLRGNGDETQMLYVLVDILYW
ncbi:Tyrosine-sulfated glycopeptide receptor 1, partial [Dichanthelium oligosanthes]